MRSQRIAVVVSAANLGLLVVVLSQARATPAQAPAPVLRGRSLELVDERGQMRARLNVESNGEVVLRVG
jgi:hypothetical protein